MFSATVFLAASLPPVVLLFKSEATLDAAITINQAFNQMRMGGGEPVMMTPTEITDDFGQRLQLIQPYFAILIQDMQLSQLADIERGIHQAVTQAKAQERAKTDPTLMAAMRAQNGPAVLSPMGMNGQRGF